MQSDTLCYHVVMPQIELSDYMTVKEAAEQLGVGDQRVRDLIHNGRLQAVKVGAIWLVERKSVGSFERRVGGRPSKGT